MLIDIEVVVVKSVMRVKESNGNFATYPDDDFWSTTISLKGRLEKLASSNSTLK